MSVSARPLLDTAVNQTRPPRPSRAQQLQLTRESIKATTVPSFQQNLLACQYVAAGKQLMVREERLFVLKQDGIGTNMKLLTEEEDSEARLAKDYEDWLQSVMQTLENSLDLQTSEELEILKEAVQAVFMEEERDLHWNAFQKDARPPWRPRRCKKAHQTQLQQVVQRRMEEAQQDSSISTGSTVQKSIISRAKRLKEDLLKVTALLGSCYPEEENMCQFFASLYHQSFSAKLREVAEYTLCDEDCFLLLLWVNQEYPNILNCGTIKEMIDHMQLDPLLPEEMLVSLEQQFLTSEERELNSSLDKILAREEATWSEGAFPEPMEQAECYPQAIDLIQCFHGHVEFAEKMLGDVKKAWRITGQMSHFLSQHYIEKKPHLFSEEVRRDCLCSLMRMIESSHSVFTSQMHKDLKHLFKRVGSSEWLKNSEGVCQELLTKLDKYAQKFNCFDKMSHQELLGTMHKEFLAEYVRKLMKQKIKLFNESQHQMVASGLCRNSENIHGFFTSADPDSMKLELVNLMRVYPDLRERHISALLRLKGNLSPSVIKMILKSVFCSQQELGKYQESLPVNRSFFSTVRIK
ncbi:hypothetical protein DNTS_030031 [Danionella cerebrum]|uniref:Exocyst complex component Sec6 n=1 Tax=Danionella cerebrum TaxID=2873325 RepID=A0A553NRU5_9TELE|nr:hypothetical protein DNTS_030031 [Danionella translucida]